MAASGEPRDPEIIQQEIKRLEAKLFAADDPDIAGALEVKLASLRAELPVIETPNAEADAPPAPPTESEAAEAERLTVLARLEKGRGNRQAATDLLKQAAAIAPGSATVVEALADDLMDRKRYKDAKEAYARAHALEPKNVGIERKLANAALASATGMSVEDQLRMGGDGPLLSPEESLASAKIATLLSFFLPGSGQIVMGRNVTGISIMAGWVLMIVWIVVLREELRGLMGMMGLSGPGGPNRPNSLTVMVPIAIAAMLHLTSIFLAASAAKAGSSRRVDRPIPPVDKPFEL